jgi:uncharacterized protein YndB with AHSA1/START domain
VALETATFKELHGGRTTRVTAKTIFQSVADRDAALHSGMEKGVAESHERLDELLAKVRKNDTVRL